MKSTSENYATRKQSYCSLYFIGCNSIKFCRHSYYFIWKKGPVEDLTEHLVVLRVTKCIPHIDDKINLGRRISYPLLGSGFYGKPGITPSLKSDMLRKYVIPELTYEREIHNIRKKKKEKRHPLTQDLSNKILLEGVPN